MTKPAAVWTIEELNKDLRNLQKQTRETKYSSMMKLLRLALSGQQVKKHFWCWGLLVLCVVFK